MKYNFKIALIIFMTSLKYNQLESMVNSYENLHNQSFTSNDYEDMYDLMSTPKNDSIDNKNNSNFYENIVDALHHYLTAPTNEAQDKITTATSETEEQIYSNREVTPLREDTANSLYDYLFEENKKDKSIDAACQRTQQTVNPILLSAINNADKGMQAAVNFMLSGSNVNDQNNPTETSPLHFAIKHDAYKLTAILIAAGAKINAQDINGHTPLHTAVLYHPTNDNTYQCIKTLLKAGVNLYIKDKEGKTAAKIAQELNMHPLYDLIKQSAIERLTD